MAEQEFRVSFVGVPGYWELIFTTDIYRVAAVVKSGVDKVFIVGYKRTRHPSEKEDSVTLIELDAYTAGGWLASESRHNIFNAVETTAMTYRMHISRAFKSYTEANQLSIFQTK